MTSYKEFEEKINEFMEATGIRSFCREFCKGWCCRSCSTINKCNSICMNGKIPIDCAMYICGELASLLGLENYKSLADKVIYKRPEAIRWKPKRIKIGEDEEALLRHIESLDWNVIINKIFSLRCIMHKVRRD